MIEINDRSRNRIYSSNMELIDNFTDYSSKNLDFDKPVKIDFLDDEENAKNPLGSTAHYNPDEMKITIYVTGRHLKDILRSISHELIHHVQNCRGDLDHGINKLGYAQDDKHMRGMEHEAYTIGNIMNFRDFEDNYKRGKKMSVNESKLKKQLKKLINEEINLLQEQSRKDVINKIAQKVIELTKLTDKPRQTGMADKITGEIANDLRFLGRGLDFTTARTAIAEQANGTPLVRAVVMSAASQNMKDLILRIVGWRSQTPKAAPTPSPSPTPSGGGGQTQSKDPTLGLPCVDKCPSGSMRTKVGTLKGVCVDVVDRTPTAILRKGNENHPSCRKGGGKGGGGKKRSKRCPRNITIQIQKKLNELGYKLKPTRRRSDGVDGNFGKNTYDNLVKALGKKVVGRNRFVASRNCKKLLGLLQNAKPNPSPSPTPDRGLGRQPGMPIGGIVDKAIAPIVNSYNGKIINKILELTRAGKLKTEKEQKNIKTLNITLRGLRTQLRSLIMKTMRLERPNLLTDDGKEYSQNKVTARAKELANKYFSPLMDAPNKLGDANYVAQLVQRLRNIEKTTLRENVKFDLNSFTEELNDYKSEKQDQSFKKLVEGIKK